MERTIKSVKFQIPQQIEILRVAAYTRVSSGKDAMLHSLSAQVSYYSDLIQNHPGWLYCGVFSDEAVTGTKERRDGFQRLLTECRAGDIDLIITKSISRFARNTVVLLQTVRDLKSLGVDVYFEEQNIHTMSADGELMMTILASYAQEESRSASENQKWRVKEKFKAGVPWSGSVLGYKYSDGAYIVKPNEAEIVQSIPVAVMSSPSSFNVQPSFFSLGNQSPSPEKSSSRLPNQPSSITNSSIPRSAASSAIETSLSPVKSK